MAGKVTSANSAATGLRILMDRLLRKTDKHAGASAPACGLSGFRQEIGGARERNDAQVPRGAIEVDSVAYAWSWVIVAGRMTVAPPPTMFCNGANERQCPQSWVGVPCGSAFRCVLACTA